MTRTIPAPLLAELTGSPIAGECVVLQARDGTVAGFTTLDEPQVLDLSGAGGSGAVTCDDGMELSAITLAAGLDASHTEFAAPLGGPITRAAVHGGRWARARAWIVINAPGIAGHVPLLFGKVAEARVEGDRFVFEIRSAADAFNQVIGRTLSPYCSADYGDARCGLMRTAYAATVTAASSRIGFTVNLAGTYADEFFAFGAAEFLTGALAGTAEIELFGYDGAGGVVELFTPLAAVPEVGDTLNLYRGCSRLLKSDDASVPTCLTYANVVNFRGFPEVPGSNTYLKIAVPGAPGA